jgi:hypothetical protein
MEIKRYPSVCFIVREMKKDLFNIDLNNSADELSLLSPLSTIYISSSECKKINQKINNRKLSEIKDEEAAHIFSPFNT